MNSKNKNKVLVILGPTATGKSDLAVFLAKQFNGEVISADSRQVYVGMDIGTGKITQSEMQKVPHYLLDIVSPKKVFTVSDYQKQAGKAIEEILNRGKLPIICGGTGLYIQSVLDGLILPEVPPNVKLRKELQKKTPEELYKMLKNLDSRRARDIDRNNPVRLIRAIEIAEVIGKIPRLKTTKNNKYNFLQIGLRLDAEGLTEKIHIRLLKRMRQGMIAEVRKLNDSGISWRRLNAMGLEYRFVSQYLLGKMNKVEMTQRLEIAIRQYAKRQITWFKRDKRIKWFDPKDRAGIAEEVNKWMAI